VEAAEELEILAIFDVFRHVSSVRGLTHAFVTLLFVCDMTHTEFVTAAEEQDILAILDALPWESQM